MSIQLKRIQSGVYETEDGSQRIIRVIHDQVGARGGNLVLWELALPDRDAWCIEKPLGATLREARRLLAS